jgi:hypothetical protein
MSSWNMPPGVTTNMIPGNRPEDIEEERFWETLYEGLLKAGFSQDAIDAIDEEKSPLAWKAIEITRNIAYNKGVYDGTLDSDMSYGGLEMHVEEEIMAWLESHPHASAKMCLRKIRQIRKEAKDK